LSVDPRDEARGPCDFLGLPACDVLLPWDARAALVDALELPSDEGDEGDRDRREPVDDEARDFRGSVIDIDLDALDILPTARTDLRGAQPDSFIRRDWISGIGGSPAAVYRWTLE